MLLHFGFGNLKDVFQRQRMMAFNYFPEKDLDPSDASCSKPERWASEQPKEEYQPHLSAKIRQEKTVKDSPESTKQGDSNHQKVPKTVDAEDMSATAMNDYEQTASPSMQEVTSPEEKPEIPGTTSEDNRSCAAPPSIIPSPKEEAQQTHQKIEHDDVQVGGSMTDKHSPTEAACTLPDFNAENTNTHPPVGDQIINVRNEYSPTGNYSGKVLTSNGSSEKSSSSFHDLQDIPFGPSDSMDEEDGTAPSQKQSNKENQGNCRNNLKTLAVQRFF